LDYLTEIATELNEGSEISEFLDALNDMIENLDDGY